MIKLLWSVAAGVAISMLSLLGYIYLAVSAIPDLKYVAEIAYVAATVLLLWLVGRSMSLAASIALGAAIALATQAAFDALAFCCYRGLAKDMDPFDSEHIRRSLLAFLILVVWYALVAAAVHAAAWFGARMHRPVC